jgi:hypothetical protein
MRRAALVPLALLAAGPLLAQGVTDSTLTATISQRFEADSNLGLDDPRPGTSYFADTRLALGLLNETPTQTFSLGLDTGLRALWEAEEDFDLTFASPSSARAGYGQEWATGSIDTFLRYRQTEVDADRLFFDPDSDIPDDLRRIEGNATEQRFDAGLGLRFATDAPSSYAIDLNATRFDYRDDPDEQNTPRTDVEGVATWTLELTPVFSTEVAGRFYYFEDESDRDSEIREAEIDTSLVYEPSEILRLSAGLGYTDRTRKERPRGGGPRETTEDDSGITGLASVRYLFEDVTFNANARVTSVPDTRFSGTLNAAYPLPNGRLTARAFQRYGGGASNGDENRTTGVGFGLVHDINTVSSLDFGVSFARQENLDDPDEPDTDRIDASATYSRAITEVVNASLGYRFRNRDEGPEDATSHAVFFEIGRTFETRP